MAEMVGLIRESSPASSARNSMIPAHFYMPNTMTVLANGDKVANQSVFSVPVYVMDNKNFWSIFVAAIVTFLFVNFPCVSSIASRLLRSERFILPIFNFAFFAAIFPPCRDFYSIWRKIKGFITKFTVSILPLQLATLTIFSIFRTARFTAKLTSFLIFFLWRKIFSAPFALKDWSSKIRFSFVGIYSKMVAMNKFRSWINSEFTTSASTFSRLFTNFIFIGVSHVQI